MGTVMKSHFLVSQTAEAASGFYFEIPMSLDLLLRSLLVSTNIQKMKFQRTLNEAANFMN